MAKKFGKFLLATAAVGTVAAAAYYFMTKKDSVDTESLDDEDYDDFSEDLDDEDTSRNYVSLNLETPESSEENSTATSMTSSETDDFTPLSEQVSKLEDETLEESSEEFFDEDDDEEPVVDEV